MAGAPLRRRRPAFVPARRPVLRAADIARTGALAYGAGHGPHPPFTAAARGSRQMALVDGLTHRLGAWFERWDGRWDGR